MTRAPDEPSRTANGDLQIRRRGPVASLLLLVAATLPISGCSGEEGGARVGDPVPSYEVSTLEGEPVSMADLEGRPVLLNFWATWCTPCRTETPFLQSIHERYRSQGLQVVGVSMDSPGSKDDIRTFVREMDVTYRILHDPRQKGMDRFSLVGLPATFVLDETGRILFARIGPVSEEDDDFHSAVRDALS